MTTRQKPHAERAVIALVDAASCTRARAIWALLQTSGDIRGAHALLSRPGGESEPLWPSDVDLALLAGEHLPPSAADRSAEQLEARRAFLRALAAGTSV